ncbi:MAG TPA: heavy metal-responsive transcriptional regulator [Blastocatellia bacterium]|nr:heavy metal-responsive transcriptional regulator [Blastocatellia bacterium]
MAVSEKNHLLRAGELARLCGVSTDTLRHYERKGLLPAPRRSRNGYRQYSADSLDRVRLIRRALAIGFRIDELAVILKERDRGGTPCRRVRALAEAKLNEIEARLHEIQSVRDDLRAVLRDWDARLGKTTASERAGLLEALANDSSIPERQSPLATPRLKRRKSKETII